MASQSLSCAMNPGLGLTQGLLALTLSRALSTVILYWCIRWAVTTVALRDLP